MTDTDLDTVEQAACTCACHLGGTRPTCSLPGGCATLHQEHSDPRELRRLHADLRAAVARLTEPAEHTVYRDNGTREIASVPSLLAQLEASLLHGAERRASSGGGSRMPLNVGAVQLLAEIQAGVTDLAAQARVRLTPGETVSARLTAVTSVIGGWISAEAIRPVVTGLEAWARAINELLDPPRRMHLDAACPVCEARIVHQYDLAGDIVRLPALQVSIHGCVCLACQTSWHGPGLKHLAALIDQPAIEEPDHADTEDQREQPAHGQ
ncbi:DUF7341 domain-containing protein [Allokutzneria albata]|uniref:Uncharacterized protein n=1 Tax=Allokutzneria albata TaxID=211114 RepID=A0A1H0DTX8_ALLAB|nr:hypothetical protein [Allokutzneria albata]SDN73451.1 hypothetical protein SAMN04489726_7988 [Allokutzneria albata]